MQVRRAVVRVAHCADDVPLLNARVHRREGVPVHLFHVPVQCVDQRTVREGVREDDDALLRIPSLGVAVRHPSARRRHHRIAVTPERNVDPNVQPAPPRAIDAEVRARDVDIGNRKAEVVNNAARRGDRLTRLRRMAERRAASGRDQATQSKKDGYCGINPFHYARKRDSSAPKFESRLYLSWPLPATTTRAARLSRPWSPSRTFRLTPSSQWWRCLP